MTLTRVPRLWCVRSMQAFATVGLTAGVRTAPLRPALVCQSPKLISCMKRTKCMLSHTPPSSCVIRLERMQSAFAFCKLMHETPAWPRLLFCWIFSEMRCVPRLCLLLYCRCVPLCSESDPLLRSCFIEAFHLLAFPCRSLLSLPPFVWLGFYRLPSKMGANFKLASSRIEPSDLSRLLLHSYIHAPSFSSASASRPKRTFCWGKLMNIPPWTGHSWWNICCYLDEK